MKRLKNYKYLLGLLALPLIVVTCMTIEDIVHPDNPQVDSEIEIAVKIKIVTETDRSSKLAFGVLAPKSWNIAGNATLSLTTTALFAGNAVINEPLTVIPSNELNPTTGTPWAKSFQSTFGVLDNTGPVEWVVFESATTFILHDKVDAQKQIEGTVKIKIRTNSENIKLYMGYAFCGKAYGFSEEEYPKSPVVKSKLLEVSGGPGAVADYTSIAVMHTIPSTFSYGDIFSVNFEEMGGGVPNALLGTDKVHFWGKVVYDGGEKIIDEISAKTLMNKVGETSWQRYIYLKDYFGLPDNATVMAVYVHFYNADKSITVKDENNNDEDFFIQESCD